MTDAEPDERPVAVAMDEPAPPVVTSAELAECTCPEWCARDHELD